MMLAVTLNPYKWDDEGKNHSELYAQSINKYETGKMMQSKQRAHTHNACVFVIFRRACFVTRLHSVVQMVGLTKHANKEKLLELLMLNEMRRN